MSSLCRHSAGLDLFQPHRLQFLSSQAARVTSWVFLAGWGLLSRQLRNYGVSFFDLHNVQIVISPLCSWLSKMFHAGAQFTRPSWRHWRQKTIY